MGVDITRWTLDPDAQKLVVGALVWICGIVPAYAWLARFQARKFYGTGWYLDPNDRFQRRWRVVEAVVWPLTLLACALGKIFEVPY
jgi:hypothetical protein